MRTIGRSGVAKAEGTAVEGEEEEEEDDRIEKLNHVTRLQKESKLVMFPSGRDYLLPVISISPSLPPSYSRAAAPLQDSEL